MLGPTTSVGAVVLEDGGSRCAKEAGAMVAGAGTEDTGA